MKNWTCRTKTPFMIKTIQLIIFLLFLNIHLSYGQQVEVKNSITSIEGFYNLSGFETSKKLYLLNNNLFHYYAIFGLSLIHI